MSMSVAAIEPAEHIVHAGRTTTLMQLKGIGDFTIGGDIYATCMSPDQCVIVAVEQSGLIRVLQRRKPENTEVVCFSTIRTEYGGCSFVAIDDEARFLLLIDWDDRCHVFSRSINDWQEEPASLQIGMFRHVADTFTATLERRQVDRRLMWVLVSTLDKQQYQLTRFQRFWSKKHEWY
jgi:hypothetical protein